MNVTVSILHWNRPAECLATVAAFRASGLPFAITVIDNASQPEHRARLQSELPSDVEWLPLAANLGWGRAHNIVLRRWLSAEASPFCFVSAHDAVPADNCLARLLQAMEEHPSWGLACPEYGQWECPSYSVLRGARLLPVAPRMAGVSEEVDYCHGTLAIFRRDCLQRIGLFDEWFFAYGDETELGLRARARGWKVGLVWGAVVVNAGSWSGSPVIAYLWTRSTLRLARQFGGVGGLFGRTAVVLAATFRAWLRRASPHELSSPPARLRAVIDYYRARHGPPPAAVVELGRVRPE